MDSWEAETLQLLEVQLCSRALCAGWMSEMKSAAAHSHCVWVYVKYGLPLRGMHCSAVPLVAAISESCGNILQLWFIPGVRGTGEEPTGAWLCLRDAVCYLICLLEASQVVTEPVFVVRFLQDGPSLRGWHGHSPTTATRCSSWHPSASTKSPISSRDWQRWAHARTCGPLITICTNNSNKTVTNYLYSCCIPSFNLGASLQNLVENTPRNALSVFYLGPNTVYSWNSLSISHQCSWK